MTAKFGLVCFDVDSTLVTIEGIDILGAGSAVIAKMTEAAMNGDIPLDKVYAARLEVIRPTRARIDALAGQYAQSVVPGAVETIAALHDANVDVHFVTAGIAQAMTPLAQRLHVPESHVHAVSLQFDAKGNYKGFDDRSPLTKAGGKAVVVRRIRESTTGAAAFVGDGVSDLETKGEVDLFIGFGGVAVRSRVKENADVYVTDADLRSVLKHLLAP